MEDDKEELKRLNDSLNERLREAEETLEAIRSGQVDAVVLKDSQGKRVYSLISPDHPYQIFFDNMDEAAVILSKEQIILYANHNFFELIGSTAENVLGSSILNLLYEKDRTYFTSALLKEKKKKAELVILSKSQEPRIVLVSVFSGMWNEDEQVCLLLRDITELKRAQNYVRASEAISKILSETSTLPLATQLVLPVIQENLGWEVMVIWLWNKQQHKFHCIDISHVEGMEIGAFKKKTLELDIKSKSLFEYVSLTNRPIWKKDITEDSKFIRRTEAIENGLRGALAFSFNPNSELAGFIELFRRTPFTDNVDNLMLDLISSLGISLGIYIQKLFLDQTKFQYAKALDLSLNSIYSVDIDGIVTRWYPGAQKTYGWSAEEMMGKSIKTIYPNHTSQEFDEISKMIVNGKSLDHFESQRIDKNGKCILVNSSYDSILDLFGKVSEIIVVEQDMTLQNDLALHLTESNARFNSFIEITEDWIWEFDKKGTFLFSNLAVYPILGYQTEEILGKSLLYFVSLEERDKIEHTLQELVAKKEGWSHVVIPLLHKNGGCRWVETNAKALVGVNDEFIGFRGCSRDITESRNLERIKNEFISIMSHEIRTPLTSIYGGLRLLISKELSPYERQELLANAYKNSIRLTNIINDTVDFERLQLGKLVFDFKSINLGDVVLESIKSSEIIAQKFDVSITLDGTLPHAKVKGDYSRLLQVMSNLLSNAIKFSPSHGTVKVAMTIEGEKVRVSVSDKGPGIPKDFQPKVFESFAQADSSDRRTAGGTGLGLYISKSIIESHEGIIQFITKQGEGTTFFFDLPLVS
ncbi:MAG: hypothetical protein BGO14_05150 [Chlamydiales bacterium 38-26]|nr:PAS domain S-box protein [Chlamydiales bacterium]OJV07862.1 MAG: hypothetical protein BGO14_05150 [Chlamydiales bacterium 38-26]